jgi:hypothetical protein
LKLPDRDEILAEMIQAGREILLSANLKLINSIWNYEKLPDQWMESIIVPIHKNGDKTDVTAVNIIQNFIEYPPLKVQSIHRWNCWGSSLWVSR